MPTILMTGAAGQIGTMLRARLAAPDRTLRLLDIAPLTAGPRARRPSRPPSPTWTR